MRSLTKNPYQITNLIYFDISYIHVYFNQFKINKEIPQAKLCTKPQEDNFKSQWQITNFRLMHYTYKVWGSLNWKRARVKKEVGMKG